MTPLEEQIQDYLKVFADHELLCLTDCSVQSLQCVECGLAWNAQSTVCSGCGLAWGVRSTPNTTIQAYRLRQRPVRWDPSGKPELTRASSCMIVFTPEGIVILGDLCPNDNNGVVSRYGYGLSWFAGTLSTSYLCGKFLSEEYSPDLGKKLAERCLKEALEESQETDLDEKRKAKLEARIEALQEAIEDDELFGSIDQLSGLFYEVDLSDYIVDGVPFDYPTRDAGLLCAIQQTFARLYWKAKHESVESSTPTAPEATRAGAPCVETSATQHCTCAVPTGTDSGGSGLVRANCRGTKSLGG